jgi:hypothetical protein
MFKTYLRGKQMLAAAIVDDAASMARTLVRREARGPGDTDNAMRRLEARYGVPYGVLWSLRYRKPKDILASAFLTLSNAYEAECERQRRAIEHDLAIAKAKGGVAAALATAIARVNREETAGEPD